MMNPLLSTWQNRSGSLLGLFCLLSNLSLSLSSSYFLNPSRPIYSLQLSPDLFFQWQVDHDDLLVEVDFQLSREGRDWVAVGFSDYGELSHADLCVAWMDWKGQHFLEDVHTNENYSMILDESQDCQDFEYEEFSNGHASFTYRRPLHPCHSEEDYAIDDGTVHVVWARGPGSLYEVNGLNISDKGIAESGFARTRLLKVEVNNEEELNEKRVSINITHKVDVGSDDTTYWCSSHKLHPRINAQKHHIVEYLPKISKGNEDVVHHMEVFQCDGPPDLEFPIWSGPCGHENAPKELQMCKKVLAAWAIGAGPFVYPKEAGIAFGGTSTSPFVMLEVHFNNLERRSGIHDESGMNLIITPDLREFDAGILELGLIYTDLMAIPPSVHNFPLSGHCLPQCTAVGLPEDGMIVFGSQLHTHQTGARVVTRHFRNGEELPEINRDDHYSTHFQEIRLLHEPRKILPGDYLQTTCHYDTSKRNNVTLGGFGFADEMCVNYIHYYPRTNLEICKSSVDSDALDKYFKFLNEWNNEDTSPSKSVKENYQSIHWSPLQTVTLRNFYETSPEMMQCTWGSGQGLPGKWREMEKPEATEESLPLSHQCSSSKSNLFENIKRKKNTDEDDNELWYPSKDTTKSVQQFNPSFTRLIRNNDNNGLMIPVSSSLNRLIRRNEENHPIPPSLNRLIRKKNVAVSPSLNRLIRKKNVAVSPSLNRLIRKRENVYPEIEPTFTRLIKKQPSVVTKKPWNPKALRMKKEQYGFEEQQQGSRRKRIGSPMNEMRKRDFETLLLPPKEEMELEKRRRFRNEKDEFLRYFQKELPKLLDRIGQNGSLRRNRKRGEHFEDYDSWGIDKRNKEGGGGLGSIPLPI